MAEQYDTFEKRAGKLLDDVADLRQRNDPYASRLSGQERQFYIGMLLLVVCFIRSEIKRGN